VVNTDEWEPPERPGDPHARRCCDEVLKRAMVQGLASMPRTAPARRLPRWMMVALFGGGSAVLFAWAATALLRIFSASRGALP